jgi:hypothetical protein
VNGDGSEYEVFEVRTSFVARDHPEQLYVRGFVLGWLGDLTMEDGCLAKAYDLMEIVRIFLAEKKSLRAAVRT